MLSRFRPLLLACCLFGTLIGCSQSSETRLNLANAGEPETLDPHRYNLRLEETLLNDLFMGLTTFNARGEIIPGMAAQWETSADGLTWTFHLRPEARWSDGTPLTAHDFVYSFRRLQDPATAASLAYFMSMLANAEAINRGAAAPDTLGVEATDDHTLVLTLQRPYPFLLERLLYPTAFPVPTHVIREHGDDWVKAQHWVSNGAYTLEEWRPSGHIDMQANPHFFEPPAIPAVRYLPVVNEQSAYNRYRRGELHAIASFPNGELADLVASASPDLRVSDLLSMMYLVFNTQRPPFDDVRVRQALSLVIDQSVLTEKILRTGAQPATSFAPALISQYNPVELPHAELPSAARIARAETLLQAAGYSDDEPLRITLRHVAGLENKQVNVAIAGMWQSIGVVTDLQQADLRGHFGDLRQGQFDVAWAGWIGENNAEHYLSLLQSDIGDVNYGRFHDETFDALMAQAQTQADLHARNQLLRAAAEVAVHYYPVVPLYTSAVRRMVDPRLLGWHENLRDMHPSRFLNWQTP